MIKRNQLSTSIVKEFQRRIKTGEYKSGDKLPPQDELAAIYGVSRTILREAFTQLSLMGLVEMVHGRGTFVSSLKPYSMLESLSPLMLMDRCTISEFFEARVSIEPAIASLAAQKATGEDIREIEAQITEMDDLLAKGEAEAFIRQDRDFHIVIAKVAKNGVLSRISQLIRDMIQECIGDALMDDFHLSKQIMEENRRIFNTIKNKEPEKARRAMETHIQNVETEFKGKIEAKAIS